MSTDLEYSEDLELLIKDDEWRTRTKIDDDEFDDEWMMTMIFLMKTTIGMTMTTKMIGTTKKRKKQSINV